MPQSITPKRYTKSPTRNSAAACGGLSLLRYLQALTFDLRIPCRSTLDLPSIASTRPCGFHMADMAKVRSLQRLTRRSR
jgi:hypothetical protein